MKQLRRCFFLPRTNFAIQCFLRYYFKFNFVKLSQCPATNSVVSRERTLLRYWVTKLVRGVLKRTNLLL